MNMTAFKARIQAAMDNGKIDRETAIKAHAAINEKMRYGSAMTNKGRDSVLTHRFGI